MKKLLKLLAKKGQGSVEYIFLLASMAFIILALLDKVRDQIVGEGNCPNTSFLCQFVEVYGGNSMFGGNFRNFNLR